MKFQSFIWHSFIILKSTQSAPANKNLFDNVSLSKLFWDVMRMQQHPLSGRETLLNKEILALNFKMCHVLNTNITHAVA